MLTISKACIGNFLCNGLAIKLWNLRILQLHLSFKEMDMVFGFCR